MQLGNEGGSAYALHGGRGDDEAKFLGELGLLDKAEGLCRIGDTNNILKLTFKDGFA